MKYSLILLILFTSLGLSAQFGVSAKYNLNNFNSWNDYYQDANVSDRPFRNTVDLGVNYWFRLKNKRVEFLPELIYSLKKSENTDFQLTQAFESSMSAYGFQMNTHIYFMDLENDCNCPTFSKQGNFVPKAIHLIISPGFSLYNTDLTSEILSPDLPQPVVFEESGVAFNLGLGLGLDIGVSDLLTVTPFFLLRYATPYSSGNYNNYTDQFCGLECNLESIDDASNFHPQFGIRIGFRPDYVKQNRY